jgi:hypothetical protein
LPDALRDLVSGDLAVEEGEQVVRVQSGAGAEHDDRPAYLAPPLVGHADHGTFRDGGMLVDHLLDLGRVDVFPARDDQVLEAVADVQVAVLVGDRDVTGVQPTVGGERRDGLPGGRR